VEGRGYTWREPRRRNCEEVNAPLRNIDLPDRRKAVVRIVSRMHIRIETPGVRGEFIPLATPHPL
jgi:hypothetical protein